MWKLLNSLFYFSLDRILFFGILALGFVTIAGAQHVDLTITPSKKNHTHISELKEHGYVVTTTGTDPYFGLLGADIELKPDTIFAFQYQTSAKVKFIQLFLSPGEKESESITLPGLNPSSTWTTYWAELGDLLPHLENRALDGFRLDLGNQKGISVRIKNFVLRDPLENEKNILREKEDLERAARNEHDFLVQYLERDYPIEIARLEAKEESVFIELQELRHPGGIGYIVSLPMDANETSLEYAQAHAKYLPDESGSFKAEIQELTIEEALRRKFAVVWYDRYGKKAEKLFTPLRYVDSIQSRNDYQEEKPKNRKGLGDYNTRKPQSDIDDLDIGSVTVNIVLGDILATRSELIKGAETHHYAGRDWYVNPGKVRQLDETLKAASKKDLIVSAILLLPQASGFLDKDLGKTMVHSKADPSGIFTMPAMNQAEGVVAYAAIIDYLAQRYHRADKKFGRIHHWIIHNEVNSGWVWTNAGDLSPEKYMELYVKSMRLTHNISRLYNPHSKVFISLDHHWTARHGKHGYSGKKLLDLLVKFCELDGQFDWGIAFHPYPENLFDPKVWDDNQAQYSVDTPKITFKNIDVLVRYLSQDSFLYNGKPRTIHFSEQGLNSLDYSRKALLDQAAGMAYAWHKLQKHPSIEVFHYHNWIDNRHEGGLKIGLRKFRDHKDDPLGIKPIWQVFKAIGTEGEKEAFDFALPIIGVDDWESVP